MSSLRKLIASKYTSWLDQAVTRILDRMSKSENQDRLSVMLANILPNYLQEPLAGKYFQFFEEHGFHLTPAHYYSPIPQITAIDQEVWSHKSEMVGVDLREAEQLRFLTQVFPRFLQEYNSFPHTAGECAGGCTHEFYFDNVMFSGTDALVLYCMVRHIHPRLMIEVGSGFSTRIAAQAALQNGDTRLVSIEPYPDPILVEGFPGLDQLIQSKVQSVDLDVFGKLGPNDILFIDTSHTVKVGSDVNYLYLEVLPRLQPGVVVHIHDIFLPGEYPAWWMINQHLFWNEQYLLHAFLAFNSQFEILFMNALMGEKYPQEMRAAFPKSPWWGGGSVWLRRKPDRELGQLPANPSQHTTPPVD